MHSYSWSENVSKGPSRSGISRTLVIDALPSSTPSHDSAYSRATGFRQANTSFLRDERLPFKHGRTTPQSSLVLPAMAETPSPIRTTAAQYGREVPSTPLTVRTTLTPNGTEKDTRRRASVATVGASLQTRHRESYGPKGFCNFGATCYMNAALQAIVHIPGLMDEVAEAVSKGVRCVVSKALLRLPRAVTQREQIFSVRQHEGDDPSDASQTLRAVKAIVEEYNENFRGHHQCDSHEFLLTLIDVMHEELNQGTKEMGYHELQSEVDESFSCACARWRRYHMTRDNSKVMAFFRGWLGSTVWCRGCDAPSYSFDPVLGFSLPLRRVVRSSNRTYERLCGLSSLLENFFNDTEITPENCVKCTRCHKRSGAKRTLLMVEWPRVLILHLKRFTNQREKDETVVTYDETLDPPSEHTRFCGSEHPQSLRYRLMAVIAHKGSTLSWGHYTAHVRVRDEWFLCNDTVVERRSLHDALHARGAYVLLYESSAPSAPPVGGNPYAGAPPKPLVTHRV